MKVLAEWLQSYLSRTISTRQLADALELAGIEVEQIIYSNKFDKNIVVGLVKKVAQHPKANRLHLAEVDNGRETLRIVCGAPNLKAGQKVALAQVGTRLPDGTAITGAEIRGEISQGMLASARELNLGNDHSGILELP